MSRRVGNDRHQILGFGYNRLREGIPGIHGETGAVMSMGRLSGGYRDVVATSSLSPCPFCQCCLALHMGIRQIRILDAVNYRPDFGGYAKVGLTPVVSNHAGIIRTFGKWVRDPKNATIWDRDIGVWKRRHPPPFDLRGPRGRSRLRDLLALAHRKAIEGLDAGEAPIGAVILDSAGEVIGCGHPRIATDNDPSAVAAMVAWRACGGRDHWKDKTLLLTCGPDHIAYSMFHVFGFAQLVVASDRVFSGQINAVRRLGVAVQVMRDVRCDRILREWMRSTGRKRADEYFGSRFVARLQ
jgi:tRNA(Arg) A34 adenosine deaminase TadA